MLERTAQMDYMNGRGITLRGSAFDYSKARLPKKKAVKPKKVLVRDSKPHEFKITDVDELMKELRSTIHAMFNSIDPNLPTTSVYDNYLLQAFRHFTTMNGITPEAFHHKICKLGLNASRSLCMELFGRIDQEDLGEIDLATFSRRVFLPATYFNFDDAALAPNKQQTQGNDDNEHSELPRPNQRQGIIAARPSSAHRISSHGSSASSAQFQGAHADSGSGRESLDKNDAALESPRMRNDNGIRLIYESMPLEAIEKCISLKLQERTSRDTDRFRQAFRLFTKSEGITYAEFHRHLEQLQIHLSLAKSRALFSKFDLDGNGLIELSEFTAALFKGEELEENYIRPTSTKDKRDIRHHELADADTVQVVTTEQVMRRLRDKLEQHSSKESDRFRQALKIFSKPSGITRADFKASMCKLGLNLPEKQLQELFELFDYDRSGDLDLNEFVQGVMLDDYSTKFWSVLKDKQKLEESRRKLYSMAVQSVQNSWSIAEIEQMLREKIEQRTSRSSDCFRQAFRIFKKVNGIKPDEFHAALVRIGLALDRSHSDILFARFDKNGSGDIDLDEFIHGVLPPDYIGHQWVAAADEMHRIAEKKKKTEAKLRPDQYMTEIEMESWSLDEIEKRIRDKIMQATSKSSDTFRQAYKIFKKSNHITIDEFRDRLLALGFRLTPAQCLGLFRRYDVNQSGDIDLQEFCMRILPPDYTGDGDHWTHSDKYKREKRREKIEFVKKTKNGLTMLPKFDARKQYTRSHHEQRTFNDLKIENEKATSPPKYNPPDLSRMLEEQDNIPRPPRTPRAPLPNKPPMQAERTESASPRAPARPSPSPRKVRLSSETTKGPDMDAIQGLSARVQSAAVPTSPPGRPSPRARPTTPQAPRPPPQSDHQISSPRRKQASNERPPGTVEYEDMGYVDEDGQMIDSMDLVRAKRREHRRQRRERAELADMDDDIHSVRYAESVASTTATSKSRALATATYTPQSNYVLFVKRLMQAAKKKPSSDQQGTRAPKRPSRN